jgi:hypothetical protein
MQNKKSLIEMIETFFGSTKNGSLEFRVLFSSLGGDHNIRAVFCYFQSDCFSDTTTATSYENCFSREFSFNYFKNSFNF